MVTISRFTRLGKMCIRDSGESAVANCRNLRMAQIPDSVHTIAQNAFDGDARLVIRCYRGSAASTFRMQNKILCEYMPVSYTHLDVYKRQGINDERDQMSELRSGVPSR